MAGRICPTAWRSSSRSPPASPLASSSEYTCLSRSSSCATFAAILASPFQSVDKSQQLHHAGIQMLGRPCAWQLGAATPAHTQKHRHIIRWFDARRPTLADAAHTGHFASAAGQKSCQSLHTCSSSFSAVRMLSARRVCAEVFLSQAIEIYVFQQLCWDWLGCPRLLTSTSERATASSPSNRATSELAP